MRRREGRTGRERGSKGERKGKGKGELRGRGGGGGISGLLQHGAYIHVNGYILILLPIALEVLK